MPLDYAEFAHHYEASAFSEAQRRDHFHDFSSIMECLVRYFWGEAQTENRLGIRFDGDTLALIDTVESRSSIHISFNGAASGNPLGKEES